VLQDRGQNNDVIGRFRGSAHSRSGALDLDPVFLAHDSRKRFRHF